MALNWGDFYQWSYQGGFGGGASAEHLDDDVLVFESDWSGEAYSQAEQINEPDLLLETVYQLLDGTVLLSDPDAIAPGAAQYAAGDPVNMVTGEFYTEELPDMHIPVRGVDLSVVRQYRSKLIYDGPFGFGWTWNHGESITFDPNPEDPNQPYLKYFDERRTPYRITWDNDSGEYVYPPGTTFTISKNGDGYVVRDRYGAKKIFDPQGFLLAKEDSVGNRLTVERNDSGRIDRLVRYADLADPSEPIPAAAWIQFHYAHENSRRVTRLSDHTSAQTDREVVFTYGGDEGLSR